MELTFTIETDDIYQEETSFETSFELLFKDAFRKEVAEKARKGLAAEEFKRFSQLVSDSVIADIKLRMENFLSEEIALHGDWGKPTFVGSIEDLIKKRFDEILLRHVDGRGNTLKGCTSDGKTWIEYRLGEILEERIKKIVENAAATISKDVREKVKNQIIELKNNAIKNQVNNAFAEMIGK